MDKREWISNLTQGELSLQLPKDLTKQDLVDSIEFLELVLRQLKRWAYLEADISYQQQKGEG